MPSSLVSYSHSLSYKNSTLSSNDNMILSSDNSIYISYLISITIVSITTTLSHSHHFYNESLSTLIHLMAILMIILILIMTLPMNLIHDSVSIMEIFNLNYSIVIMPLSPLISNLMTYSRKTLISSPSSISITNHYN